MRAHIFDGKERVEKSETKAERASGNRGPRLKLTALRV